MLGVAAAEDEKPLEGEREETHKEEAKVKKRRKKHTGTSSRRTDKKKSKEKKRKASRSVPKEEEQIIAEEPEVLGLRPAPKPAVATGISHISQHRHRLQGGLDHPIILLPTGTQAGESSYVGADTKDVREVLVKVSGSEAARESSIGNAAGFGHTAVPTDLNGAKSQKPS